jgi:hypothetical protein
MQLRTHPFFERVRPEKPTHPCEKCYGKAGENDCAVGNITSPERGSTFLPSFRRKLQAVSRGLTLDEGALALRQSWIGNVGRGRRTLHGEERCPATRR